GNPSFSPQRLENDAMLRGLSGQDTLLDLRDRARLLRAEGWSASYTIGRKSSGDLSMKCVPILGCHGPGGRLQSFQDHGFYIVPSLPSLQSPENRLKVFVNRTIAALSGLT